jgi:hypothetical protein
VEVCYKLRIAGYFDRRWGNGLLTIAPGETGDYDGMPAEEASSGQWPQFKWSKGAILLKGLLQRSS